MPRPNDYRPLSCAACTKGAGLGFDFSMAFQPIVNIETGQIHAHEALVRGPQNEPASEVFTRVNDDNLYRFDQTCRVKAIKLAAELGVSTLLNVNFMPNAVYRPELCIRTTLEAAEECGFPTNRIVLKSPRASTWPTLRTYVPSSTTTKGAGFVLRSTTSEPAIRG